MAKNVGGHLPKVAGGREQKVLLERLGLVAGKLDGAADVNHDRLLAADKFVQDWLGVVGVHLVGRHGHFFQVELLDLLRSLRWSRFALIFMRLDSFLDLTIDSVAVPRQGGRFQVGFGDDLPLRVDLFVVAINEFFGCDASLINQAFLLALRHGRHL